MEATVLLKVLEETDRHTLSFDMDDFDFLWHTGTKAIYWDEDQQDRFEIDYAGGGEDHEPPTTEQDDWFMYWIDETIGALLAFKIAIASGYEAHLLWDREYSPKPCWCLLTDHGSKVLNEFC